MPAPSKRTTARLSRLAARECLNFNLRKADRAVSQAYDKAIASSGLKGTQFTLLNAISLGGGASISSLAETLIMDRTTLTRNLAPLERDSLIEVVAGTDRRTRTVHLTSRGRTLLAKTLPLWHAEQQRLKSDLGAGATTRLIAQLQSVVGIAAR